MILSITSSERSRGGYLYLGGRLGGLPLPRVAPYRLVEKHLYSNTWVQGYMGYRDTQSAYGVWRMDFGHSLGRIGIETPMT